MPLYLEKQVPAPFRRAALMLDPQTSSDSQLFRRSHTSQALSLSSGVHWRCLSFFSADLRVGCGAVSGAGGELDRVHDEPPPGPDEPGRAVEGGAAESAPPADGALAWQHAAPHAALPERRARAAREPVSGPLGRDEAGAVRAVCAYRALRQARGPHVLSGRRDRDHAGGRRIPVYAAPGRCVRAVLAVRAHGLGLSADQGQGAVHVDQQRHVPLPLEGHVLLRARRVPRRVAPRAPAGCRRHGGGAGRPQRCARLRRQGDGGQVDAVLPGVSNLGYGPLKGVLSRCVRRAL
eukprot:3834758-Rhodomonas_salina.1